MLLGLCRCRFLFYTHAICLVLLPSVHMILLVYTLILIPDIHCYYSLFILAQHIVDYVPWYTDTPGDYYEEPAGEKIPEDLQPAKEQREWRADDVE